MICIKATYTDLLGSESIVIQNFGKLLKTRIRGVDFEGYDFDGFEPLADASDFVLFGGCLCDCAMTVDLPVRLAAPAGVRPSVIRAEIKLAAPDDRGGHGYVKLLTLAEPEFTVSTVGRASDFEYGLLWIASQLPSGFALQACITCGLSDYSPAGSGEFGCLACFRDVKQDYRLVDSKKGIFKIWDRSTEAVQETHYCLEYEIRPKGRGYRG